LPQIEGNTSCTSKRYFQFFDFVMPKTPEVRPTGLPDSNIIEIKIIDLFDFIKSSS